MVSEGSMSSKSRQWRWRASLLVASVLGCMPRGQADVQVGTNLVLVSSPSKVFILYLEMTCQVALWYYTDSATPGSGPSLPIWITGVPPTSPPDCTLKFSNATGNLVASGTGGTIWQSGPARSGPSPYSLALLDSGILEVVDAGGLAVWNLNCPPGYNFPVGGSTCTPCPSGQSSTIGSACIDCPPGFVSSLGGICVAPDHVTTPLVNNGYTGGYGSVQINQLTSAAGLYSLKIQPDCSLAIQNEQGLPVFTRPAKIQGPCQMFLQVDGNIVLYSGSLADGFSNGYQIGPPPYTLNLQDTGMLSLLDANGAHGLDLNCPPGYILVPTQQFCTECPSGQTSLGFDAVRCVTAPPPQSSPPPPPPPPPSAPPPPPPPESTPEPQQAGRSSVSNVGAIVGGVVGGVVGLALFLCVCCLLFFCLCGRERRGTGEPTARATLVPRQGQKHAADLRAAPNTPGLSESPWTAVKPESMAREPAVSSVFTPGSLTISRNSKSDCVVVPLGLSRLTHVDDGGLVLGTKREPSSVGDSVDVHAAVDYLVDEARGQLDNTYILSEFSSSRIRGGQGEVVLARGIYSGAFAIKFFAEEAIFEREVSIYKLLAQAYPADRVFVHDAMSHKNDYLPNGLRMPSYITMFRGMSMHEWIHQRKPPALMGLWLLGEVCNQVAILHANGLVHRDIKPANLLWLQDSTSWRVIDFGCTVADGTSVHPEFTLRYAPPEVIAACMRVDSIVARCSMDVWAIGVIAFEIISGEPLFPEGASPNVMRAILVGEQPFPHEVDDRVWSKLGRLKEIVRAMLSRNPDERPAVSNVCRLLDEMAIATHARTGLYSGDIKRATTSLAL